MEFEEFMFNLALTVPVDSLKEFLEKNKIDKDAENESFHNFANVGRLDVVDYFLNERKINIDSILIPKELDVIMTHLKCVIT